MMYTSGWPKNQKRFCHRMGWPPFSMLKKLPFRCRSIHSRAKAEVSTGKASRTRNIVTRMFHTKIGIRNMTIPGARRVKMVVMMLTAEKMPERPVKPIPTSQRSPPGPGEWTASVSGA